MENFPLSNEVIWFLAGLVLLLAEMALPGLVVIFFGIGAWITALCILIFQPTLNAQILIFLISSLLSLGLLRKVIKKRYTTRRHDTSGDLEEEYIGKTVIAIEDFNEHGKGRVSYRGTTWQATCKDAVKAGQSLIIIRFDSIMLYVAPAI